METILVLIMKKKQILQKTKAIFIQQLLKLFYAFYWSQDYSLAVKPVHA